MPRFHHSRLTQLQAAASAVTHSLLNSLSQIYFQASPLSGAVLLFALYATRPALALAALAGAALANLCAHAMDLPRQRIRDGLYGYNAALSSIGLCALYLPGDWPDSLGTLQPHASLLVWMFSAGIASVAATHTCLRWNRLPALTSPFVVVMVLAALLGAKTGLSLQAAPAAVGASLLVGYSFHALAQASFIAGAPLGMLVFAALAAHRWHAAVSALLGAGLAWSLLTAAAALWPDAELPALLNGQAIGMGLNCALAAQGLSAHRRAWPWRLAGVALTAALGLACAALGWSCFTLPFVLASWIILPLSLAIAETAAGQSGGPRGKTSLQ